MLVMKFGGSALASARHIRQVAKIIQEHLHRQPIIVSSALSKVTDLLETVALSAQTKGRFSLDPTRAIHDRFIKHSRLSLSQLGKDYPQLWNELELTLKGVALLKEITPRTLDYILSFGERFATRLIAAYLNKIGIDAQAIDAFKLGLVTTSDFGQAHPLPESQPRVARALRRIKKLPIITGFIGKDKSGNITTLGRDGSDYTASFIGAALKAKEIQIWRDIDGIMTANPRIVPQARLVKEISLEEASELARYSDGVFHPYMFTPAIRHQIPIRILNIFRPRSGTTIVKRSSSKGIAKSIVYKPDISLVNLVSPEMFHHRGMVTKVFAILGIHKIEVDMLASSRISLSLAVADTKTNGLKSALKEISKFTQINIAPRKAIVCVIGEGIKKVPGIVTKIFAALDKAKIKIEMISHGATKTNLTLLVNNSQATQAVRVLHKTIFR